MSHSRAARLTPCCRRPVLLAAVLASLLLSVGGLLAPVADRPLGLAAGEMVSRQGTQFVRAGAPFRPLGVSFYNAAGDPAIYECGLVREDSDRQLDDDFARIRAETGSNVARFWAFQRYTSGGTDWRAIDRVIRLAKQHDLLLMPVLENQWPDCTVTHGGGPRDADWYAGRYREPDAGETVSYEEYVRRIVARYRDEPTIFAWMLMNEAEATRTDGTGDPEALYTFARDVSGVVKSLDPNHLVSLGVIGRGQPGTAGPSYERLHALPTIDMVTFHDYQAADAPMPGARLALAGFSQGQDWGWLNGAYADLRGRDWETVSYQLPAGDGSAGPQGPRRIGLTMFGDLTGSLYVDQIQVGGHLYDFEDGTAQGWQGDGPAAVAPTWDRAASGAAALRVQVEHPADGARIWLDAPPDLEPGATLTARVYLETPGTAPPPDTLASAMTVAARLDKPLLVDESGLPTCDAAGGEPVHSPEDRASRLDAKIDAFFRAGGAGYLVWAWNPGSSCSFAFSSGDPLNGVLSTWATRLLTP
jgi:hypothetical protein